MYFLTAIWHIKHSQLHLTQQKCNLLTHIFYTVSGTMIVWWHRMTSMIVLKAAHNRALSAWLRSGGGGFANIPFWCVTYPLVHLWTRLVDTFLDYNEAFVWPLATKYMLHLHQQVSLDFITKQANMMINFCRPSLILNEDRHVFVLSEN